MTALSRDVLDAISLIAIPSGPAAASSSRTVKARLKPVSKVAIRSFLYAVRASPSTASVLMDRSRSTVSGTNHDATTVQTMVRSEEHTSELQSRFDLVCRLLLE